jgi:hypothetical protein
LPTPAGEVSSTWTTCGCWDESGRDLVANGDFSGGGSRWFFSADDHLPWHIFNLWVQILFEQGWAGVVALTAAVLISLRRLAIGMWRGNLFSATLLAALSGFSWSA